MQRSKFPKDSIMQSIDLWHVYYQFHQLVFENYSSKMYVWPLLITVLPLDC